MLKDPLSVVDRAKSAQLNLHCHAVLVLNMASCAQEITEKNMARYSAACETMFARINSLWD